MKWQRLVNMLYAVIKIKTGSNSKLNKMSKVSLINNRIVIVVTLLWYKRNKACTVIIIIIMLCYYFKYPYFWDANPSSGSHCIRCIFSSFVGRRCCSREEGQSVFDGSQLGGKSGPKLLNTITRWTCTPCKCIYTHIYITIYIMRFTKGCKVFWRMLLYG